MLLKNSGEISLQAMRSAGQDSAGSSAEDTLSVRMDARRNVLLFIIIRQSQIDLIDPTNSGNQLEKDRKGGRINLTNE